MATMTAIPNPGTSPDSQLATLIALVSAMRDLQQNVLSLQGSNQDLVNTLNYQVGQQTASLTTEKIVRADADTTLATEITTLVATYNGDIASINTTLASQATTNSAVATDITNLTANVNGVSASGQIAFTATSGPTGAFAAWNLSLTATGHATSTASMTVSANGDGSSSVFFSATSFAIGNPTTHTTPFQTLSGGGLELNGVTQVNGTIQSTTLTGGGLPVMEIDFINGAILFNA